MRSDLQKKTQASLARVKVALTPGRLGERREEMISLLESGDAMFFSGGARWNVSLSEYDKSLKGESESLNAAFADISNCLGFLAREHGEDTEVVCAVEAVPEQQAP